MALCDARPRGADDPDCVRLAQMAADASNFAKSGFPVVLPAEARPRAYPDFMQKRDRETYESQKALGKRSLVRVGLECRSKRRCFDCPWIGPF